MYFYDLKSTQYKVKRKGVQVKAISGERCQLLQIKLEPGFESDHSHPEEQIGLVLSGAVQITIEKETKTCCEGDAYHIPAGIRHSFKVVSIEPAEILDIFSPPKEENRL
jgi:unsaturated pyranuronate lyase